MLTTHSHNVSLDIMDIRNIQLIIPFFELDSGDSNSLDTISHGLSRLRFQIATMQHLSSDLILDIQENTMRWESNQEKSEGIPEQVQKCEEFLELSQNYITGAHKAKTDAEMEGGIVNRIKDRVEKERKIGMELLDKSGNYTREPFEKDVGELENKDLEGELQNIDFLERLHNETNLKDLLTFEREFREYADELIWGTGQKRTFSTHYSVGFSRVDLEPGDFIFAIDGVRTPLVLRRCEGSDSAYRVVGECYLWAALDLDYWNPGTKKGVWRRRPYDLGEQTRLIEIRGVVPSQTGL